MTVALVATRRFFTRAEVSPDLRVMRKPGGRGADEFYRDRWPHDKVVRSTHWVICTDSCTWKVYVKDGIITREAQQTDYPSVGPDRPEYEPPGVPPGRRVLLVNMLTAPVGYLTRPYLVYRSRDPRLGTHAPPRGWERTS